MSTSVRIGSWCLGLLVLLTAAGCGNSFIGRRYNNFTAYYNTFYNARQAYESGVTALEGSTEPIDRTQYIAVYGPGRVGGNVSFQNAIEKGAEVLRSHPNSKWVDDALLLIGKSYFYQANYVGAEQKFREVLELDSPLDGEARIWLARTLIVAGAYGDARAHLASSMEEADESDRWTPQLHIALGELNVKEEDFEQAALQLETGLDDVSDADIEARALFLLGQVYETLQRYEDAVAAYRDVEGRHPRYELAYAANLSAARVLGTHVDEAAALETLRRMERDGKNYANRHEIAFVRGRVLQAQNRSEDAVDLYRSVLYDQEAQVNQLRGRIHYALGELYRDDFHDYSVAAAHFDSARTALANQAPSLRSTTAAPQYAPEAITDAQTQAETFRSFAGVRSRIARMDSLLELGSLSQEEFDERILEIRQAKAEELAEQQRRAQQLQAEQGFQGNANQTVNRPSTAAAQTSNQYGFLFHRDPIRVQEARLNFINRWGERPHVPNWRRSEAVAAATSSSDELASQPGGGMSELDPSVGDSPLPSLDYSEVPRDSISQAGMRAERALARYELGNVLFLSMNRPDSAAAWYRRVIDEDANEAVAQRAFYALAEVQRSLGDSTAARGLFEQVLRDYPDSDFAGRVRDQLGMRQEPRSDSLVVATSAYDAAYERWQRGSFAAALDSMIAVAARHPDTPLAPKALLAAGRIYLEWARADTMDVFGPMPVSVSTALLERVGLGAASPERTPAAESDIAEGRDAPGAVPTDGPRRRVENGGSDDESAMDTEPLLAEEERRPAAPPAAEDDLGVPADSTLDGADGVRSGPDMSAADTATTETATTETTTTETTTADTTTADTTTASLEDTPTSDPIASADGAGNGPDEDAVGRPDTTAIILHDTLAAEPLDTSDLLASSEEGPIYLESLYTSVQMQYPRTPYAEQAGRMLEVLERRRQEMNAPRLDSVGTLVDTAHLGAVGPLVALGLQLHTDSLASVQADSLASGPAADTLVAASDTASASDTLAMPFDTMATAADTLSSDSLARMAEEPSLPDTTKAPARDVEAPGGRDEEAPGGRDEEAAGGRNEEAPGGRDAPVIPSNVAAPDVPPAGETAPEMDGIPVGDAALHGDGGIAEELGGYTIVLGVDVERAPMASLAQAYLEDGFRADVIEMELGGTTVFRAALGHFRDEDAAEGAMEALQDRLAGQGQVVSLP